MEVKTSDLTMLALDWAVAKIENPDWFDNGYMDDPISDDFLTMDDGTDYSPSTYWAQGGPIIESEYITIDQKGASICACIDAPDGHESNEIWANGPTPLIAAMRVYVASKLGDTVDVPTELLGETV
jgi:hypothetical protein